MKAPPHSHSAVHHHAEQGGCQSHCRVRVTHRRLNVSTLDTIVYGVAGRGAIVYGPGGANRVEMAPGDWAIIPAFAEHQEVNEGDEEVVWAIVRSGGVPAVVNLDGWGQPSSSDE